MIVFPESFSSSCFRSFQVAAEQLHELLLLLIKAVLCWKDELWIQNFRVTCSAFGELCSRTPAPSGL